jgi:general secretion pathway protein B
MSYILDALKKAESERNSGTGATPELYAGQPAFVPPPDEEIAERRKAWVRFGLSAVVAILLGLVWLKFWRAAPPSFSSSPIATAPAPGQQAPRVADAAPPAETAPPPAAPPSSMDTAPREEAAPKPAKPKASPAPTPKKPAKAAEPSAPKPGETKAAAEERIAGQRELPPHIQNEIPALSINGYIYSANKADRTVLINNKLLREGDQVAPDLTLERLTPTGMVLNYKGYRYRTSY